MLRFSTLAMLLCSSFPMKAPASSLESTRAQALGAFEMPAAALPAQSSVRRLASLASVAAPAQAKAAVRSSKPLDASQFLNCEELPGTTLCRRMLNLRQLLSTDCSGDACLTLWRGINRELRLFHSFYDDSVPWRYAASDEMGALAHGAAKKICAYQLTGPADLVTGLVTEMNTVLPRLKTIQENAPGSERTVRYCVMTVR